MATITVPSTLNVIEKYRALVEETLSGEGIYVRTKETIIDLADQYNMTLTDKATLISNVIANLNNTVISGCMSTALQWESTERDIALQKLKLAKELDVLNQEILLKTAEVGQMDIRNINEQADGIRRNGTATVQDGVVTSLTDEGLSYNQIELTKQQVINAEEEEELIQAKTADTRASTHSRIADTYVNHGIYDYTIGSTGVTGINNNTGTYNTLSESQRNIAEEQAKGYTYNAWANAVSGVSSTIGVALTSELDIFSNPGEAGYDLIEILKESAGKLRDVQCNGDCPGTAT